MAREIVVICYTFADLRCAHAALRSPGLGYCIYCILYDPLFQTSFPQCGVHLNSAVQLKEERAGGGNERENSEKTIYSNRLRSCTAVPLDDREESTVNFKRKRKERKFNRRTVMDYRQYLIVVSIERINPSPPKSVRRAHSPTSCSPCSLPLRLSLIISIHHLNKC